MAVYVRKATVADTDVVCDLAYVFAHEANSEGYVVSKERIRETFEVFTTETYVMFLLFVDDSLVGFIAGNLGCSAFSYDVVAFEDFFYIHPAYRGRFLFVRLMDAFLSWAEENGAVSARMQVESGITEDRTIKLLGHFGFKSAGRSVVRMF